MEAMKETARKPRVRIIRMRNVPSMDATGMHALTEQYNHSKKQGIVFLISDIHTQPYLALERSGLIQMIGEENVFRSIDEALERAREALKGSEGKP